MDKFSDYYNEHMDSNMMSDYLDRTINQVYEVLANTNTPWPLNFNNTKKTKFIDSLIDYFQEREEYERCAKLLKIKNKIINVENNKSAS